MARAYKSSLRTYEDAHRYLGNKEDRPHPDQNSLRVCKIFTMTPERHFAEEIVVKYHGNVIVKFSEGNIEFPYRGVYQDSMSTKRHINAFK
jgi:hypothetical protein